MKIPAKKKSILSTTFANSLGILYHLRHKTRVLVVTRVSIKVSKAFPLNSPIKPNLSSESV